MDMDKKGMAQEAVERKAEQLLGRLDCFELLRERMGQIVRHTLQAVGEMLVDWILVGRMMQKTKKREANCLRGESCHWCFLGGYRERC